MNPSAPRNQGPGPGPNPTREMERKGSVRRAREMLEAGRRPRVQAPQPPVPAGPQLRPNPAHMTQWPLPHEDAVDPHGRHLVPRGPPPQRPPRPDAPSPSVYSERSVSDAAPSPLHFQSRQMPSFSQPRPQHPALRHPEHGPEAGLPRSSVATEDLFRQSGVSSTGSIPSIPDFPLPTPEQYAPQRVPRGRSSNLAPPNSRPSINRRSSVSPIPEENSSPRGLQSSIASSRAIPSSWGSGPAESEILGTYLDMDSDESDKYSGHEVNGGLVRQASLGKRGKPSLRTIQRSTTDSPAPPRDEPKAITTEGAVPIALAKEVATEDPKEQRDSFLTSSSDSSHFDPEKPPIVLGHDHHQYPALSPNDDRDLALEKEAGGIFPRAAPTMSDKRPGGRKPPRLDMGAVRDAEKRGSLTSLPDLIRRATKLATNLEHGRTASRNDVLNVGGPRFPHGHAYRKSGSIRSILASFPPPAATPDNGRSSWPHFFRRSTLHHLQSHEEAGEYDENGEKQRGRRCCGMRPGVFIIVLLVILAIILVAVLVPVFLVAIPNNKDNASCASTNPCENGGVSVSSDDVCSCVCTNGFTGSRCTIAGDASCTTTEVNGKNATMGSELPRLFTASADDFQIPLDPTTIMALFSQNNVSCTTENTLVEFRGVDTDGDSSSNNRRRSVATNQDTPTKTLAARNSVATANGIVFDNSEPETTKPPKSTSTATATDSPSASPSTAGASSSKAKASEISSQTLDFTRIAVLYILEKTGTLGAAMLTEENLQNFLKHRQENNKTESSLPSNYTIDLADAGLIAKFTLDFGEYAITSPDGSVVGG